MDEQLAYTKIAIIGFKANPAQATGSLKSTQTAIFSDGDLGLNCIGVRWAWSWRPRLACDQPPNSSVTKNNCESAKSTWRACQVREPNDLFCYPKLGAEFFVTRFVTCRQDFSFLCALKLHCCAYLLKSVVLYFGEHIVVLQKVLFFRRANRFCYWLCWLQQDDRVE